MELSHVFLDLGVPDLHFGRLDAQQLEDLHHHEERGVEDLAKVVQQGWLAF